MYVNIFLLFLDVLLNNVDVFTQHRRLLLFPPGFVFHSAEKICPREFSLQLY